MDDLSLQIYNSVFLVATKQTETTDVCGWFASVWDTEYFTIEKGDFVANVLANNTQIDRSQCGFLASCMIPYSFFVWMMIDTGTG